MTKEKLEEAKVLLEKINKLKTQEEKLKKEKKNEIIISQHGSSGWQDMILTNPKAVERVKVQILYEVTSELYELEKQFNEL